MDIQMLYWHWLVLGLLLVVGEIFIPSFTILWFGLGALVVGLIELFVPMSLSTQVLLWTLSSVGFTLIWFKIIKVKMTELVHLAWSQNYLLIVPKEGCGLARQSWTLMNGSFQPCIS